MLVLVHFFLFLVDLFLMLQLVKPLLYNLNSLKNKTFFLLFLICYI